MRGSARSRNASNASASDTRRSPHCSAAAEPVLERSQEANPRLTLSFKRVESRGDPGNRSHRAIANAVEGLLDRNNS